MFLASFKKNSKQTNKKNKTLKCHLRFSQIKSERVLLL